MTLSRLSGCAFAIVLAWVSVYLCREFFFREHLGYMNSMHGFWMALARLGGDSWWRPGWFPYWDAGMPFEFTYAPLVPALTAAVSKFSGMPVTRAFYCVAAAVYCLGPLTMYLLAWRWGRSPGPAFTAAAIYLLTAPSQLLVPDSELDLRHLWDARNMYLSFVWDETPHLLALAVLPLGLICLDAAVRGRRRMAYLGAVVCFAGMLLANAFGATILAFAVLAYIAAIEPEHRLRAAIASPLLCFAAWVVTSRWLPLELWLAIGRNASLRPDSGWSRGSWYELAIVILGSVLLVRLLRRSGFALRFFALFTWIVTCLPVFGTYLEWHFVPQPNRYKVEMDWAWPLLGVFLVRPLAALLPRRLLAVSCLALLAFAYGRVVSHRRFAKVLAREGARLDQSIERRAALWIEANLPGQRVYLPGSIAQWANLFSDVPQLAGGSYPTAFNPAQRLAAEWILWTDESMLPASILWAKAFAVRAVAVPGKTSPEFWKSFPVPSAFAGLPVLWNESDTPLYDLAGGPVALARVVPVSALVRAAPASGDDTAELRRYVAAIEDIRIPKAEWRWLDNNRVSVRAKPEPGQVVSVAVNHHPRWRAWCADRELSVRRDGLGLMWIDGRCDEAEIELVYGRAP